jgi:pimeloyl-ACP methyl ester carboxylesterase
MRSHAEDLTAVLDHLDLDRAVLAGHSMGAYVATTAATADPKRWSSVVLIDGGVALPLPDGVDPDDMLAGVLGPALARLEMTFESRAAYHDFWRGHPALVEPGAWNEDTEAWLDHDLCGEAPELRSAAALEAVRFDGRELLVDRGVRRACFDLQQHTVLLRAPRGLLNQVPPLLPDELLDPLRQRWPIRLEMLVDNTNHYSIVLAPRGARTVAAHLSAATLRRR